MLSLVFDFCYYATFVIVPIVVFLLVNDDEKFHSKGGKISRFLVASLDFINRDPFIYIDT